MVGINSRIDNIDVADGGCLGDARFFVLLEQKSIDVGIDLGYTGEPRQIALDIGQFAHLFFVTGQLLISAVFQFVEIREACSVNSE